MIVTFGLGVFRVKHEANKYLNIIGGKEGCLSANILPVVITGVAEIMWKKGRNWRYTAKNAARWLCETGCKL